MGINLAEIQQKVDRLLYNIAEQNRRAYQMFYDPTPQDVELPQLDENGNLITVTIPNRAKIKQQMWDDVNAATGLWSRIFYIDAVNGDDNNPGTGTSDAPFKTLAKAIESIPNGGTGVITLLSDYTIPSRISTGNNKTILIRGPLNASQDPIYTLRNDPTNPASQILINSNTKLYVQDLIIEANNNSACAHWATIFKATQTLSSSLYIGRYNSSYLSTKIILKYPLIDFEACIGELVLRNVEVTATSSVSLARVSFAGKYIYAANAVSNPDGNVTFPNIGIN